MDLKTNMTFTGMREPYLAKYKAGVDKNGLLQYVDVDLNAETGWTTAECLTLAETVPFTQVMLFNIYSFMVQSFIHTLHREHITPPHGMLNLLGSSLTNQEVLLVVHLEQHK